MAVGGDGGAIITTRPDLTEHIRMFIDHGRSDKYRNEILGTNFRLSEIQCGIGRVQLKHLDGWVNRRNKIADRYLSSFEELGLNLPVVRPGAVHAWHQFVLRVADREAFIKHMDSKGISTGIHYPIPCHLQPIFTSHPQGNLGSLPFTENLCDHIVSIPVFPLLEDEEVDRIIDAVHSFKL